MRIQEYLAKTLVIENVTGYSFQRVRPRIVCKDGVSLSVQAGSFLYSTPRIDKVSEYSEVEVGYPSVTPPESWFEYAEGGRYWAIADYKDTIYPYIPIDLVQQFVDDHGGIDFEKSIEGGER